MKQFIINGSKFSDLDGFYDEVGHCLCPGFSFGRNLDALNDVFAGGLSPNGIQLHEPAQITWSGASKSKQDLGSEDYDKIVSIIVGHGHTLNLQ